MALFPKCTFEVLLTGGGVVPGARAEGTLVLHAPEAIPRADHIQFDFVSTAHAFYGSGNNRHRALSEMFRGTFKVDLPTHELAAGTHRFPFWVDVPSWLPPSFQGSDYALRSVIETSLDVKWAIDPKGAFGPAVLLPPASGMLTPAVVRSPPGFHEDIVLEATLESSVVVLGEPLRGRIALRSGFNAKFESIELSYSSVARMRFARKDLRPCAAPMAVRISADALRSGESVPFELACPSLMLPTVYNPYINHEPYFIVRAILAWRADPAFELKLDVLPRGSQIIGEGAAVAVGNERLEAIATLMANASGLRRGRGRELVVGDFGPVHVSVVDAPRDAVLGVDIELTFPNVELDIKFRRQGALGGAFGRSPLLPENVKGYSLDARFEGPSIAAFFANVLGGTETAGEIRLSDHHLSLHYPLANDESPLMTLVAQVARQRAIAIEAAIRALPFPMLPEGAREAWTATAAEQQATLVPTGPSLHGIMIGAKVLGGEERRLVAAIRTVTTKTGMQLLCDVDLARAGLPETAIAMVESEAAPESELLRVVRETFPTAHVLSQGAAVTLESPRWETDPRTLLPALEAFLWFVIDARGERRVESPYR